MARELTPLDRSTERGMEPAMGYSMDSKESTMGQVKAFMSDPGIEASVARWYGFNRYGYSTLSVDESATHAEAEARAILAVSEPVSSQADYYDAVCLWPAELPRPTTRGTSHLAERVLVNAAANKHTFALIGETRAILATALAAFVGEES